MKRNAIIIAAGTSSRFVPLSYEKPKGLIEVRGEILIERQIRQLQEAGVFDITIVVGYMAESFVYLKGKYDVSIVLNEDYSRYNNISSLVRVVDRLQNTYICCSDQYYVHNPFLNVQSNSLYAALYAKGATNEYCMEIDDGDYINRVNIGGADSWYMAGFAYFTNDFSKQFRNILITEFQCEKMRQLYWEDVYIKYMQELPKMQVVKFNDGELYEFDSLDELRQFDTTYISNTRSTIIKEIAKTLQCNEQDLSGFKKVDILDGRVFAFQYNNKDWLYNNGRVETC